jgi:polar amino acid transport system permease protein
MDNFIRFFIIAIPEFYKGMIITLEISAIALAAGFLIGLPVALARVYGNGFIRRIAVIFSDFIRGIPLLVLLFVVYFGLPEIKLTLSALTSAMFALGINSGAYQAEYFRGAIQAIGEGQMMAARSIGMSKVKAIWYVIVPQALRLALPAWSNEAVSMIKYTSVVYLIAVPDLMTQAKVLASKYFNPIQSYLAVGVFYVALVGIMTLIMRYIEFKSRVPGLELGVETRR